MQVVIQILASIGATLGFCLMFHTEKEHLLIPSLGGGLCWGAYLLFVHLGCSIFPATFFASFLVGIYGVVSSYLSRVPTTVYFIPCCIPLIPGGNLYYTIMALIRQDWLDARNNAIQLGLFALGISLGLALAMELDYMRRKLISHKGS